MPPPEWPPSWRCAQCPAHLPGALQSCVQAGLGAHPQRPPPEHCTLLAPHQELAISMMREKAVWTEVDGAARRLLLERLLVGGLGPWGARGMGACT